MCGVQVPGGVPGSVDERWIEWASTPRPPRRGAELRLGSIMLGPALWVVIGLAAAVAIGGRRLHPIFQVQALIVLGSLGAVVVATIGRVVVARFCGCAIGWIRFGGSELDVEYAPASERLPLRSLALISLGGPLANLQVAAALVLAASSTGGHPRAQLFVFSAAAVNLWLGVRGLLPVPTLWRRRPTDGLIALRALRAAADPSVEIDPVWLGVKPDPR